MKNFINKPNNIKRWILLLYSILSLIIIITYIIFNHTFFRVDWKRYDIDGTYRGKVDEILKHGVFWINGNLTAINSTLLILLLAVGAVLSLLIFYLAWHNLATRTWTPILCLAGFLIPLIVHGDGNILKSLIIGYIFIIAGASFSVQALRFS
ncbi:transporter [Lactococcus lactis subsp. lactis]|nr:transporter [Lactococcus lactis subsp. lactis]MBU7533431.1 transporter [Lactococcus lactis]MBR8682668.1 transporter [Lactococcus lactis subsp. lactis]MBR8687756.1 transporter [Lactococcus lactis subsp. lactis]MBS3730830.1 transporter [Lactococcus lactis subsp. lactis]